MLCYSTVFQQAISPGKQTLKVDSMAGLIPQAFIDDLLTRVDIVDVVDSRVKLRKTGKNYSAICPFHQEKSPSFSVEPDKQFYYCFGCGAGGNAIGFVMNYEHMEFPQAVETLASQAGLQVPKEEGRTDGKRQAQNNKLYAMLQQASLYYQQQLRQHARKAEAVNYLKGRGLSGEIAKTFTLGYAPAGWDNLLKALSQSNEDKQELINSGLLVEHKDGKEHKVYDRFRQRIIFPIRDSRGRVIAFGGRVLGDDKPKYLNSPETPVFHKGQELYGLYEARKAMGKLQSMLIVEGYMDVVALAQHGIPYAVATLGTATSAKHLKRLFRLVSEVIFCFDGDEAGRTAAWRALQAALPLMVDGRQIRFLFLPDGEDPDSQVRKIGQEKFTQSIDQAMHLDEFFFTSLSSQVDINSLDGKARLSSLALVLIKQLPESIFRQLMLKKLSEITGADKQSLDTLIQEESTGGNSAEDTPAPQAPPPYLGQASQAKTWASPQRNVEDKKRHKKPIIIKAIDLLLQRPALARKVTSIDELKTIDNSEIPLLIELIELLQKHPETTTYQLMGHCYGTPLGNHLTKLNASEFITPDQGIDQEFSGILSLLLHNQQKYQSIKSLLEEGERKRQAKKNAQNSTN